MGASTISNLLRSAESRNIDLAETIGVAARYLRIAHQIPGRVRFKIDAAVLDEPAIQRLGEEGLSGALGAIRGVRDIRLNKLARSCTIEYDRALIPDQAWNDLLAGQDSAAARALFGIIENKYEEVRRGQL